MESMVRYDPLKIVSRIANRCSRFNAFFKNVKSKVYALVKQISSGNSTGKLEK